MIYCVKNYKKLLNLNFLLQWRKWGSVLLGWTMLVSKDTLCSILCTQTPKQHVQRWKLDNNVYTSALMRHAYSRIANNFMFIMTNFTVVDAKSSHLGYWSWSWRNSLWFSKLEIWPQWMFVLDFPAQMEYSPNSISLKLVFIYIFSK